jgi:hypothetical protein
MGHTRNTGEQGSLLWRASHVRQPVRLAGGHAEGYGLDTGEGGATLCDLRRVMLCVRVEAALVRDREVHADRGGAVVPVVVVDPCRRRPPAGLGCGREVLDAPQLELEGGVPGPRSPRCPAPTRPAHGLGDVKRSHAARNARAGTRCPARCEAHSAHGSDRRDGAFPASNDSVAVPRSRCRNLRVDRSWTPRPFYPQGHRGQRRRRRSPR